MTVVVYGLKSQLKKRKYRQNWNTDNCSGTGSWKINGDKSERDRQSDHIRNKCSLLLD